jgi:hypothetical protein
VRFVPLAARLAGPLADDSRADRAKARERIERLLAAAAAAPQPAPHTILLYPGRRAERAGLPVELGRLLNPPTAGLAPAPGCAVVPVSPLDLYSAERVDRVTRRVVLDDLFARMPPHVACQRVVRDEAPALAPWLAPDAAGTGLVLRAVPSRSDLDALRAAVQQRVRKLRPRHDDRLRAAWSALPDAVDEAVALLDAVARCPVCGRPGRLLPWSDGAFKADCTCASWGVRGCAGCGERIPYLTLHAEPPADRRTVEEAERLDHELGRDVLAVPSADGADALHCAACGA